jgi:primosomal protein N' (replication factor Y)
LQELEFRAENGYPPLRPMVRLEYVTSGGDRTAEEATRKVARRLTLRIAELGLAETQLVGPAPAFFHRIRGRTRWHIVVQSPEPHTLLQDVPLGPGWRVDVDPIDLL